MAGNFVVGQTSKITVYSGMTNEAIIKGLNSMSVPMGWESQSTTISEFGVPVDIQVSSGLSYNTISCSGNFTLKDPTQALIRQWSLNATHIDHMRFYLDACSFVALDLINNADGYYQIGSCAAPQAEKSGVYSFSFDVNPAGPSTLFENHISGTTLTFTATTRTVTDSANGFVAAGFKVGQVAIIDHNGVNNPLYVEIATVAAGSMTFAAATGDVASITNGAGTASTAIHSGAPMKFDDTSSC